MTNFSPDLVKRIKKYFSDRNGVQLSDEEAEQYLESLAEFFGVIGTKDK